MKKLWITFLANIVFFTGCKTKPVTKDEKIQTVKKISVYNHFVEIKNFDNTLISQDKGKIIYFHKDFILGIAWEYKTPPNAFNPKTHFYHFIYYNGSEIPKYLDFEKVLLLEIEEFPQIAGYEKILIELFEAVKWDQMYNYGKVNDQKAWKEKLYLIKNED